MKLDDLKTRIAKEIDAIGYYLYDMDYQKRNGQYTLSVHIDHKDGITLDDCQTVSEHLNPLLDAWDPFPGAYNFEVTSPGAERELRNETEIRNAVGKYVHVETYEGTHEGRLVAFDEDLLQIKTDRDMMHIRMYDVTMIRMAIKL
jgi:ribosome maturation factor RimP